MVLLNVNSDDYNKPFCESEMDVGTEKLLDLAQYASLVNRQPTYRSNFSRIIAWASLAILDYYSLRVWLL